MWSQQAYLVWILGDIKGQKLPKKMLILLIKISPRPQPPNGSYCKQAGILSFFNLGLHIKMCILFNSIVINLESRD